MAIHNELGLLGELEARRFLEQKNYVILETNFRTGHLEIDIVAMKEHMLIIVEVRTRSSSQYMFPSESIGLTKIKRIVNAAQAYIRLHNWQGETRFDIISIISGINGFEYEHIEDAFLAPLR